LREFSCYDTRLVRRFIATGAESNGGVVIPTDESGIDDDDDDDDDKGCRQCRGERGDDGLCRYVYVESTRQKMISQFGLILACGSYDR
jgi:hypothetical protein